MQGFRRKKEQLRREREAKARQFVNGVFDEREKRKEADKPIQVVCHTLPWGILNAPATFKAVRHPNHKIVEMTLDEATAFVANSQWGMFQKESMERGEQEFLLKHIRAFVDRGTHE